MQESTLLVEACALYVQSTDVHVYISKVMDIAYDVTYFRHARIA